MVWIICFIISKFILIIRILLSALIILFLLPYFSDFTAPYRDTHVYKFIDNINELVSLPIDLEIKKTIPTEIKGKDVTPLIKALIVLIILSYTRSLKLYFDLQGELFRQKKFLNKLKNQHVFEQDSRLYKSLKEKIDDVEHAKSQKESQVLLHTFIELKKEVQDNLTSLAFLSIDIVDSTGMKKNENKLDVQYDFMKYKKMVKAILDDCSCLCSVWTPDGVMTCFKTVDNAIKSAKSILIELKHFNKRIKHIKRDFIVRCGINAGVVYFDEKIPLEEMTDQIIDVAGHMQKYAGYGSIAISETLFKNLDDKQGFYKADKIVDGHKVFEYQE